MSHIIHVSFHMLIRFRTFAHDWTTHALGWMHEKPLLMKNAYWSRKIHVTRPDDWYWGWQDGCSPPPCRCLKKSRDGRTLHYVVWRGVHLIFVWQYPKKLTAVRRVSIMHPKSLGIRSTLREARKICVRCLLKFVRFFFVSLRISRLVKILRRKD